MGEIPEGEKSEHNSMSGTMSDEDDEEDISEVTQPSSPLPVQEPRTHKYHLRKNRCQPNRFMQ